MTSIALFGNDIPKDLPGAADLKDRGFALVRITDLLALEVAKQQYELAFLEKSFNIAPRSQRDSAPVEQHIQNARPHTEPDPDLNKHLQAQQARIQHLLKIIDEYRILLRGTIG